MSKDIKIGVFAYNWPHFKTQSGLFNLCVNGFKPVVALCADPVELKFYKSKIRVGPKDLYLHDTKALCEFFDIGYEVTKHNSSHCEDIIKSLNLDIGIVLGARIIKQNIIDAFNIGIVNMHPGILPQNRGLDNLKWAILKGMKQGVTSHLIDSKIDRGRFIDCQEIPIYKDDTLVDLFLRLQMKEQKMMIEAIDRLKDIGSITELELLGDGKNYHRAVPPEKESLLIEEFKKYLERFGK
tara:strand:+ start:3371 stop:4087 length:717 start_codon:yes stop_codon:yes gene_type:complete